MKKLTRSQIAAFAAGQLGWSLLNALVVSYLVYFYQPTIEAGLPYFVPQGLFWRFLTVVGVITALGRLFDAVTDPLIAWLSDRSQHPDGRRIPFLKYAALPLALSTVLVFWTPVKTVSSANVLWLFFILMLYYLSITAYVTPFNALIPELGKTQSERLNITTAISFTFILGTAIAYMAPALWESLVHQGWDKVRAIRTVFAGLSGLALICLLIPVLTIRERDYVEARPVQNTMLQSLAGTFKNDQFKIFVASDIAYWIALALFQTGLPFYIRVLLRLPETMISVLFIVMTAASLLYYIPINRLSKRIGKKRLINLAFMIFSLAFLMTAVAGERFPLLSPQLQGILLVLLSSLPLAIFGILPQAVVADICQYDTLKTGENREGMFYAARTFAFKMGQMLSMVLFTSLLTLGSDFSNDWGIRLTAVGACLFCLAGLGLFQFYNEGKVIEAYAVIKETVKKPSKEATKL